MGLCSAALHGLGEAGNLCFKGVQAFQEEAHLEGNIEVVVLRYRLELGLVLVEQDERVQVLDFRQRWRRPSLHVGRLTAAVVGLGVVDQRPVHAIAQLRVALPFDEDDLLFPAL